MAITFNSIDTKFNLLGNKRKVSAWISRAVAEEGLKVGGINVIFCNDSYLLSMNRRYLKHNYYTDIITFDYCERGIVAGDLFISIDTVKINAAKFRQMFHVELLRVIIHGVMHLVGYKDKTNADAVVMRKRENYYLAKFPDGLLFDANC